MTATPHPRRVTFGGPLGMLYIVIIQKRQFQHKWKSLQLELDYQSAVDCLRCSAIECHYTPERLAASLGPPLQLGTRVCRSGSGFRPEYWFLLGLIVFLIPQNIVLGNLLLRALVNSSLRISQRAFSTTAGTGFATNPPSCSQWSHQLGTIACC